METKINKEIRDYQEALFFGLSLRQFVCSVLALGVAVAQYCAFLNALPVDATAKHTLFNRNIDRQAFRESMLMSYCKNFIVRA